MATEKKYSFIVNFLYFLILGAIIYFFVHYALGIIAPFVLAFLVAAILNRPIRFLTRVLPFKRKQVAVLTVGLIFLLFAFGLFLLGNSAVVKAVDLVKILPDFYRNRLEPALLALLDTIENIAIQLDIPFLKLNDGWEAQFIQPLSQMVTNLSKGAMVAVSSLPGLFLQFIFFVISAFFISIDYPKITNFCMSQFSPKSQQLLHEIKNYIVGTLWVCLRSYLIIMGITFVELSIGLSIIGVGNSILIAALISVFDILPILGTGGIMIPWTVVSVVWGHYSRAVSLLIVYLIITIVRNIVEPKIVGGQLGLHPVVTLASMVIGVKVFGGLGLFGLPIGLSLLVYLDKNGTINIFKKNTVSVGMESVDSGSEVSVDKPLSQPSFLQKLLDRFKK